MKTHEIKIWPQWFDAVRNGTLSFQVRKNDRNYEIGDTLVLNEFRPGVGEYTGRTLTRTVIYILRGESDSLDAAADGIKDGYCGLGLR